MNSLKSLLFKTTELCLYDFPHPGEIPKNEARIEAEHRIFEKTSPDRNLIVDVQGPRLISARFERDETCFAALHGGKVVSYIWGSHNVVGIEEVNMGVQPEPSEVYLYDAFTLEPWRGMNLYPAVLRRALEHSQGRELRRSMIFVDSENAASRRGVVKAGFTHFQSLIFRRVLFYGWPEPTRPLNGHATPVFVR